VNMAIGMRPNRDVPIMLLREGQPISVTVRPRPETRFEIGSIGVVPDIHPVVRALLPGDPAERAGMKVGDQVLAINGEPVFLPSDLIKATSPNAGKTMDVLIRRGNTEKHLQITPLLRDGRGMIGLTPSEPTKSFQPGPVEAVTMSVERTIEGSALIFKTVGQLLSGQASPRQLMGPVAIAQLSGESAQAGWVALFALMSMISLNLGILNLMPIPVLDGGHILILALEGIARRDFSMRVKEKMFLAGFVLLMMLMVTVIYNDLTRVSWIERLMPWRN
jgi:regulator of sigma E protease